MSEIGYDATPITDGEISEQEGERKLARQTLFAWLIALPLLADMFFGFVPEVQSLNGYAANLTIALIVLIVLIYSAGHIFKGAWRAFTHHNANMDTLIALGTGAAWFYSTAVVFFSPLST